MTMMTCGVVVPLRRRRKYNNNIKSTTIAITTSSPSSSSCGHDGLLRRFINIVAKTITAAALVLSFSSSSTTVISYVHAVNPHCNICKYADSPIAYELGNPTAVLATLGSMTMTCEEAQDYAFQLNGKPGLTTEQCEMAQMLAAAEGGRCGCPNEQPPPSSSASGSGAVMGRGDNPVCVLCLSGNEPTMNGFIGGLQCFELAFDGLAGDLNTEECFLSQLAADSISNVCGCREDPTSAPVPPPTPFVPVPTSPPTALPSASPTVRPTPEPTVPPTLRPTPGKLLLDNVCFVLFSIQWSFESTFDDSRTHLSSLIQYFFVLLSYCFYHIRHRTNSPTDYGISNKCSDF